MLSDSNFEFLKDEYPSIASLGLLAEKSLYDDPNNTIAKLRIIGEKLTFFMLEYEDFSDYEHKDQFIRLKWLQGDADIPEDVIDTLHAIRKKGNRAVHTGEGTYEEARFMLRRIFHLCDWFFETYEEEEVDWDYVLPLNEGALDDTRIAELEALVKSQEEELKAKEDKIKLFSQLNMKQKEQRLVRSYKAASKIERKDENSL